MKPPVHKHPEGSFYEGGRQNRHHFKDFNVTTLLFFPSKNHIRQMIEKSLVCCQMHNKVTPEAGFKGLMIFKQNTRLTRGGRNKNTRLKSTTRHTCNELLKTNWGNTVKVTHIIGWVNQNQVKLLRVEQNRTRRRQPTQR